MMFRDDPQILMQIFAANCRKRVDCFRKKINSVIIEFGEHNSKISEHFTIRSEERDVQFNTST